MERKTKLKLNTCKVKRNKTNFKS